jgi:hypothetical protein
MKISGAGWRFGDENDLSSPEYSLLATVKIESEKVAKKHPEQFFYLLQTNESAAITPVLKLGSAVLCSEKSCALHNGQLHGFLRLRPLRGTAVFD